MELWVDKYKPKSLNEIPQAEAIHKLMSVVKSKGVALIHGPPGSCKTSTVYAIAKELNLELIEVNASDKRNAGCVEDVIGNAAKQMSLFSKSKIILVDEIDGLSGREDRGGVGALAKLIGKISYPMIMTANDPYDKKFNPLRKKSNIIEFGKLESANVANVLKIICDKEKIIYAEEDLKMLGRMCNGDLRAAINDLQLASIKGTVEINNLESRNPEESVFNALNLIFKSKNFNLTINAFNNVDLDLNSCMLWMDENMPKEYKKYEDLWKAYDALSKADVFRGRIIRWQYWRFLVYQNLFMTVGVAMAKTEKYVGFTKMKQTMRLLKIWQSNMRNSKKKTIAEIVGNETHQSTKQVIKDFEWYRKFLNQVNLGLTVDEINWLNK